MIHRKVTSASIARSVAGVFDWITTPGYWPRYSPLALRIDSAEPWRPLGIGERFTEHARILAWRGHFDWTVEVLERPSRVVLTAVSAGDTFVSRLADAGKTRIEYILSGDEQSTQLTRELTYDEGFIAHIADVLGYGSAIDGAAEVSMATMKAMLENPLLHGPHRDPDDETLLHEADPLADEAVASLVSETGDCTRLEAFLAGLYRGDPPPQDLPEPMRTLLAETSVPPAWACQPQIDAASQVFFEWGVLAVGAHLCASLPETYVLPRVAKLLNLTGQLDKDPKHSDRRLWFTVRICLDVLQKGGLEPGARGLLAVQRLRLIHATIRMCVQRRLLTPHRLAALSSTGLWDTENGRPISQLEMLHTLMTFSWVVVRAFDDLGAGLTPYQREGYIHLWNVAGALLGVRPELLPRSAAEAEQIFETIKQRFGKATPQAVKLGEGLVVFWEGLFPEAIRTEALELMHFILSKLINPATMAINGFDRLPEYPGSAAKKVARWLKDGDRLFHDLFEDSSDVAHAVSLVISLLMRKVTDKFESDSGMFDIPEQLYKRWSGVKTAPI